MNGHMLERFLHPGSIAVIGAGDDPLRVNGRALMFMLRHHCKARLLPVNPNRDEVQGIRCYRKIADLPEVPDVGMVVVNKNLVLESIDELGRIGCPFAIVTSVGYAEAGNYKDQEILAAKARQYGMRLMGPNCMGLINLDGPIILSWCAALEHEYGELLPGDVALVSQSGALLGSLWDMSMGHGLGHSCLISTGNEADLELADFVEYLAGDPRTKVITAFIESPRKPERFLQAVMAAHAQKKPVVVYKVGRTAEGARSAAAHTGAIVGSDATFDAMCRSYGIIRVESLDDLATTAMVLRSQPPAKGNRLGVFSCSGGAAGLISDQLPAHGLRLAEPGREFEKDMTAILGWNPPHNPLDIAKGSMKSYETIRTAMERFAREPSFDQIMILMTMVYFQKVAPGYMLEALKDNEEKPVIACWLGDKIASVPRNKLIAGGVPAFRDVESCLSAARALAFLGRFREKCAKGLVPAPPPPKARRRALAVIGRCGRRLDEASSKEILALYGLPVPEGRVVQNLAEAKRAAAALGYPLAAKGLSPDVLHKTEAGAVRLGIAGARELEEAFAQVAEAVRTGGGEASFRGVLLEKMQPPPVAEVIVGSTSDQPGYHTIVFGLGGVWVEVLKDVSTRLVPIVQDDAEEMIDGIRGRRLLEGFRGAPAADRKALARFLMGLSALVWDLKDQITEMDVNPVLAYADGCVAVDALIRLR